MVICPGIASLSYARRSIASSEDDDDDIGDAEVIYPKSILFLFDGHD
jgi:hypothetical protein